MILFVYLKRTNKTFMYFYIAHSFKILSKLLKIILSILPQIWFCCVWLIISEEARDKYLNLCVPLYNAALKRDWESAKKIIAQEETLLTTSISIGGLSVLHLAAGTRGVIEPSRAEL